MIRKTSKSGHLRRQLGKGLIQSIKAKPNKAHLVVGLFS